MERIGKYQKIKTLGSGGMATVYLVQDELTGMKMAMKLLYDHYAEDPHIRKRFLQEARLQLDLNHPNIVRCYNVERVDNKYFILLEYIPGPALSEVIKQRGQGLKLEEIIPVFTQILAGMDYAHQKGVIHRDIKPMNILLSEYSGYFHGHEVAKISDFGIAKALDQEGHTRTGAQLGSPYFMSPEQIQNAAGVDHRSDIYSLGVLLYQLATGKLPYHPTDNPIKLMEEIVKDPIIDPRTFNKDIPKWLVDVIYKATDKDPEKRFQTCSQFSNLIFTHFTQAQQPIKKDRVTVQKKTPVVSERPKKKTAKSRSNIDHRQSSWLPLVLGVVVAAFLLAGVVFWQFNSRTSLDKYIGEPVEQVQQELINKGHEVITEYVYRENIPHDQVFNLEFTDHSKSAVRLWVSKGPKYLYLPDLIGADVFTAINYLKKQGLKVNLKKVKNRSNAMGVVLKTVPPAETLCKNGDEVTLVANYNAAAPLKDEIKFSPNAIKYLRKNRLLVSNTLLEHTFSGAESDYKIFTDLNTDMIKVAIENNRLIINKKQSKGVMAYYFPVDLNGATSGIIARLDLARDFPASQNENLGLSVKYEDDFLYTSLLDMINHKLSIALLQNKKTFKWKEYPMSFSQFKNKNILIVEVIALNDEIVLLINGEMQNKTKLPLNRALKQIGLLLPEKAGSILLDNLIIDGLV
ncbi:protein kinase domain-containing protein [Calditrichota bacterium GD2]